MVKEYNMKIEQKNTTIIILIKKIINSYYKEIIYSLKLNKNKYDYKIIGYYYQKVNIINIP